MSTKIRNISIEKTFADDADYFIGDEPGNGTTYKISKNNLFTGIIGSGGSGGYMSPNTVFVGNYQVDFKDLKNHSYSVIGSPIISGDKSPFVNGSSLYLPGNSYLEYASSNDFRLDGDWACETFVWIPSLYATNNTYAPILSISGGGMNFNLAVFRSGYSNNGIFKQIYAQVYGNNVEASCYSIASVNYETWNHLFVLKTSNMLYFFLNGMFQSSVQFSTPFRFLSSAVLSIGYFSGVPALMGGYIAGCRIRSSGIKIPTLPFTE